MNSLLKNRLRRLGAMVLAAGLLITAVGCSSGNSDGTADVAVDDGATATQAEATSMKISKYVGGVSLKDRWFTSFYMPDANVTIHIH